MKAHIDKTRAYLGELAGLQQKTERQERAILESAEKRLAEINPMIERQRVGIEAAPEAAQDRYTALIEERGHLQQVIAKAEQVLGNAAH